MSKSFAAACWSSGKRAHLRVYSSSGSAVTERCWDGDGWYTGDLSLGGVDYVSAMGWTTGDTGEAEETHLRVYTKGSDGGVVERYWDGGWEDGEYTPA